MMPLNPRHAQKLGFYSLFAFTKYLGALHQLPTVGSINELGADSHEANIVTLIDTLQILGSKPSVMWNDININSDTLSVLIKRLQNSGLLNETRININHCSCMKIQHLSQALLRSTKSSLISKDGKTLCCDSLLHEAETLALTTTPLCPPETFPLLYPLWAKKEFDWIYSQFKGQQLLFSRIDSGRRFLITTASGKKFWLDNDVVGMFFPSLIKKDGIEIEHLVSGVSIMRQAALMVLISSALGVSLPKQIYFLPRVDINTNQGPATISSAIGKFGSFRVDNALLWCATSGRQNIVLDKNMFPRMLDKEPVPTLDFAKLRRSILVR